MFLLITLFFSFLITTPHEVSARTGFLTGSKTFEITDYSIVKKGISSGNYIESANFTAGGYQWAIEFYPQSWESNSSDFVSVALKLMNPTNVVKAIYTHRLLDWKTSTWSTNTPVSSDMITFSTSNHTAWGSLEFMRRSDLEASSYLRNDTLVIKTTVWVSKDSSTLLLMAMSNVTDVSTGDDSNQWNLPTDDRYSIPVSF